MNNPAYLTNNALASLNRRPRLLVVDDQQINILTLYQIFHSDHEVFVATGGAQALEFCRTNDPPDLVLLDIMMPDMDGLTACQLLKAQPATADVPVIFVTAQSTPDEETRALESGGVDFITKPVNPSVVRARVRTHLTLKAQSDLLRSQALIDGLTGVANRRRFDEALQIEWRRGQRNQSPLSLLIMDIDHFKLYNDHYGHQAGDDCLRAVATTLKAQLFRAHDLCARYGGEEFVCLLPDCATENALTKAEELRQAVESLGLPHAASPTAAQVTISLGLAATIPDNRESGAEELLKTADAALYLAKRGGRNRVQHAAA